MRDAVTTIAPVGRVDRSRHLDHSCTLDCLQVLLFLSAARRFCKPSLNGPPLQQVLRRGRKRVQLHWNRARAVGLLECMRATACNSQQRSKRVGEQGARSRRLQVADTGGVELLLGVTTGEACVHAVVRAMYAEAFGPHLSSILSQPWHPPSSHAY